MNCSGSKANKQCNEALSVLFGPTRNVRGPAKSIPVLVNGLAGVIRSSGKSPICCSTALLLNRKHLMQFRM